MPAEDSPSPARDEREKHTESRATSSAALCSAGGAIHAAVAVAAGAFASHAFGDDERARELLDIGARYQFAHALALLVLPSLPLMPTGGSQGSERWSKRVAILMHVGIILFAGTLYAMALGAPRFLGAVTPIGGVSFLVAWVLVAVLSLRSAAPSLDR